MRSFPFAVSVYPLSWVYRLPCSPIARTSWAVRHHRRLPGDARRRLLGFFLSKFAASPVPAWLYLHSHGSILVVALFHPVFDIATTTPTTTALIPTAMGAVITVAAWR